ncbi:hypothetical protein [Amaricoccus tamworthensis]|uniref:hypothetical protein n=1 Tax=Amaricoccus tamworthensis TaxID=57002 RepID=UPI003C7ABC22
MKKQILGAIFAFILSTPASAAVKTYDIVGQFSGGQLGTVNFDFSIANDFTQDINTTSSGLVVNSLTSSVVSGDPFPLTATPVQYYYSSSSDVILIGGGEPFYVSRFDTDFLIWISGFTSAVPNYVLTRDSLESQYSSAYATSRNVTVSTPTPVPEISATGSLATTAALTAIMVFLRGRRNRRLDDRAVAA